MPIHIVNSRFILAVIYIQDKRIVIYDRALSNDTVIKYKTILINYLRKEYHQKEGSELPTDWTLHDSRPEQAPIYNNDGTLVFLNCYIAILLRQVSVKTLILYIVSRVSYPLCTHIPLSHFSGHCSYTRRFLYYHLYDSRLSFNKHIVTYNN